MRRTLDEIRREGLAALRERLGRSGMGKGDHASQRRAWADETSLADIERSAKARRKRRM